MNRALAIVAVIAIAVLLTAASPALRNLEEELDKLSAQAENLGTQVAAVLIDLATLFSGAEETKAEQSVQDARLAALESLVQQLDTDLGALENTVSGLAGPTGVLVNSAGDTVGPLFLDVRDDPHLSRKLWVAVLRTEGRFLFEVRGSGLFAQVKSDLFYESTDCSGPPMVSQSGTIPFAVSRAGFTRQLQSGSEIWRGSGRPDRLTDIKSSQAGSTGHCAPRSLSGRMEEVEFAFDISELGSGFSVR
jgi:hypothetical protein